MLSSSLGHLTTIETRFIFPPDVVAVDVVVADVVVAAVAAAVAFVD